MISSLPHFSPPGFLVRCHPWAPHENSKPPVSVLCSRPEHVCTYACKQVYHVARYYVDATHKAQVRGIISMQVGLRLWVQTTVCLTGSRPSD